MNQASTLRNGSPRSRVPGSFQKRGMVCVAVASGKGGVGKTFFSVNLAVLMQRLNRRVLLVDADLGLPNADILLGATPDLTLEDCVFRGCSLEEVVLATPCGVDLLAAASGARDMVSLGQPRLTALVEELVRFAAAYDVLVFDCASGINSGVTAFLAAAPQSIIVLQPEPSSLIDAYALIKVIQQEDMEGRLAVVINGVRDERQAANVLERLKSVAQGYLKRDLECLGMIPHSSNVHTALRARRPLASLDCVDPAVTALRSIARQLIETWGHHDGAPAINASALLEGMLQSAGAAAGNDT